MNKTRLFVSAFAVVAIVGSALAFKTKPMNQGSVYCNPACTTQSRIDYRVASTTTNITDPCLNGAGKEYVLSPTCTEITATTQFESVQQ
jgi:hypothetical protein